MIDHSRAHRTRTISVRRCAPMMLALCASIVGHLLCTHPALARQQDEGAQPPPPGEQRDEVTNRRAVNGEPVILNFNNTQISEIIDFIVETTGKTVIPSQNAISLPITIVNDTPLSRHEALDQLFVAFLEAGVGVVEGRQIIRLKLLAEIVKSDLPVVPADQSLMGRTDDGVLITKIFQLRYANAEDVVDLIEETIPTDQWAQVEVEPSSNSLVALCSVGLGKKVEEIVRSIDIKAVGETRVIELKNAEAQTIADRIIELYSPDDTGSGGGAGNNQQRQPFQRGGRGGNQGGGAAASGTPMGGVLQLRAVADPRNNTVTIRGEPSLLDEIEDRVRRDWDRPIRELESIIQTYQIEFRDVIVLRDLLNNMFGSDTATQGGAPGQAARGGTRTNVAASSGESGAAGAYSGLVQFQADAAANQLIAVSRTNEALLFVNALIERLDKPNLADRPLILELKHRDASSIAEEINVLFAPNGTRLSVRTEQEGLTAFQPPSTGDDQAAGDATGFGQDQNQNQNQNQTTYPWLLGQPDPSRAPVSPLIGNFRVMPTRQNALLVVGPPHYKNQIAELVEQLDRPGRQVLISVIIAEVELDDSLSLGLRISNGAITGIAGENVLSGTAGIEATEDNILDDIFDTSVLNANANINAVLEFLKRENRVRILSEPRLFTHDNEQANFFDGQDIQFVTDSQFTDEGTLNESFEFRRVGIELSVRPRITVERNVDLLVDLGLSSLVQGVTTQSGGLIIDQRNTQTRVIIEDRQTVVISGILSEQESDVKRKVPFFGDIPILGALFTSTDTQNMVSELIVFITPIVVDNPSETNALNAPFRDRLDQLRRPLEDQLEDFGDPKKIWGHDFNPNVRDENSPPAEQPVNEGTDTETEGQ